MENDEIEEIDEDEEPRVEESTEVSADMQTYLLEKYGGKAPDSEIEDYLNNVFTQHDLPHGQKRKQTAAEMLFEIRQRKI